MKVKSKVIDRNEKIYHKNNNYIDFNYVDNRMYDI